MDTSTSPHYSTPSDGACITPAWLRDFISRNAIVRGAMCLPSPEGVANLAGSINAMASLSRSRPEGQRLKRQRDRVEVACRELAEILPELIPELRARRDRYHRASDLLAEISEHAVAVYGNGHRTANIIAMLPELREVEANCAASAADLNLPWPPPLHNGDLAALEMVLTAVQHERLRPEPSNRVNDNNLDDLGWHDLAPFLAHRFQDAMRITNPDLTLGVSDTGPVARFVTAAIPLVTGEAPTIKAVARHLQRQSPGKEGRRLKAMRTRGPKETTGRNALVVATAPASAVVTTNRMGTVADSPPD